MSPITWFARVVAPNAWKQILSKGDEHHYEVSCTPVTRQRLFANAKREAQRHNRIVSIEVTLMNGEDEIFYIHPGGGV